MNREQARQIARHYELLKKEEGKLFTKYTMKKKKEHLIYGKEYIKILQFKSNKNKFIVLSLDKLRY